MSIGFKWNMLITSFLPLWVSIFITDLWSVVEKTIKAWNKATKFWRNILEMLKINAIPIIFILIITVLCLIACIKINKFLKINKPQNNNNGTITNIRKNSSLSAEFLIAYILPMLVFNFTSLLHIVLFILYFSILAFLCIRNNHVYVNIFLELKGYKLYTADIEFLVINKPHKYIDSLIISKNDLVGADDEKIIFYDFDNKIYIDLTEDNNDKK